MRFLSKLKNRAGRRQWAAILAVSMMVFSLPSGAANPVEREYEDAVRSFRQGRLSEAFGQFMAFTQTWNWESALAAGLAALALSNSGTSARPMPEFQPTVLMPSKTKPVAAPVRIRPAATVARIAAD